MIYFWDCDSISLWMHLSYINNGAYYWSYSFNFIFQKMREAKKEVEEDEKNGMWPNNNESVMKSSYVTLF